MTKIKSQKLKHEQIQYIEFVSTDIHLAKIFYTKCFDWNFTDYGTEYTAFSGDYVDGGFRIGNPINGSILIVIYSDNINNTKDKVIKAGGTIVKDIFDFPGGKRFQFIDLDGYELAVWSE